MKKLFPLLLFLAFLAFPASGEGAKMDRLPEIFAVSVTTSDRVEGKDEKYIRRETLVTSNAAVNADLQAAADALDLAMVPLMQAEPNGNARNYSRLDIETSYSRTGHSWLSALTVARVSWRRVQTELDFTARVYDLETGARISLADLFPPDSPAWEALSRRVLDHMGGVFPGEARDTERIALLASREALETAEFTLGGAELTLHYLARDIGLSRPGMVHVRFFYPEFQGMMTQRGAYQTDNRHWKMVALTCDDGPRYFNSIHALNAFRRGGARVTWFTSGHLYEENAEILRREFDSNHLIESHSFRHISGKHLSPEAMQNQIAQSNAFLLGFTGEPVRYFRAPGGVWVPWQEKGVGLPIIQWSVDTYDYTGLAKAGIFCAVRDFAQHGDIVLMHDTGEILHTAVPLITDYLTQNAFLMVTIEELAWAEGVKMEPNVVYARFMDGQYDERKDSNLN